MTWSWGSSGCLSYPGQEGQEGAPSRGNGTCNGSGEGTWPVGGTKGQCCTARNKEERGDKVSGPSPTSNRKWELVCVHACVRASSVIQFVSTEDIPAAARKLDWRGTRWLCANQSGGCGSGPAERLQ